MAPLAKFQGWFRDAPSDDEKHDDQNDDRQNRYVALTLRLGSGSISPRRGQIAEPPGSGRGGPQREIRIESIRKGSDQ